MKINKLLVLASVSLTLTVSTSNALAQGKKDKFSDEEKLGAVAAGAMVAGPLGAGAAYLITDENGKKTARGMLDTVQGWVGDGVKALSSGVKTVSDSAKSKNESNNSFVSKRETQKPAPVRDAKPSWVAKDVQNKDVSIGKSIEEKRAALQNQKSVVSEQPVTDNVQQVSFDVDKATPDELAAQREKDAQALKEGVSNFFNKFRSQDSAEQNGNKFKNN